MPLNQLASIDPPSGNAIPNGQDLPKNELDIFYRAIPAFIPAGKTWETMTEEEKEKALVQYRFGELRPGMYQAITGISTRTGEVAGS